MTETPATETPEACPHCGEPLGDTHLAKHIDRDCPESEWTRAVRAPAAVHPAAEGLDDAVIDLDAAPDVLPPTVIARHARDRCRRRRLADRLDREGAA